MSLPDPDVLYVALIGDPSRLVGLRRLVYRCAAQRRCLLLDALEVGDTVLLHQKRFKQSRAINEARSSEGGRRKNTFDGNNHWMPRTYYLESSALSWSETSGSGQELQCDHVGGAQRVILSGADFATDWHNGHAEVIMRPDGSRYAR